MKMRWIALLTLIAFLVWGCAGGDGSGDEQGSAESVEETQSESADNDTEGVLGERAGVEAKALVQVLISGLGVVQLEDSIGAPYGVFFIEKGKHSLTLKQGEYSGTQFSWKIRRDELAGKTISLMGGPSLSLHKVYEDMPLRGLPASTNEDPDVQESEARARAADYRWLLRAETLGGSGTEFFNNKQVPGAWLLLDSYQLETCALTLDKELTEACMVRSAYPGNKLLARGAAEALVLRGEVVVNTDDLSLELFSISSEGEKAQPVVIDGINLGDCSADKSCVNWNGTDYQYVFDAYLDNGPDPDKQKTDRRFSSIHGKHLKTMFAKMKFSNWEVFTPGCYVEDPKPSDMANCDEMCSERSAGLLVAFPKVLPAGGVRRAQLAGEDDDMNIRSTLDVAMCPLVQYP